MTLVRYTEVQPQYRSHITTDMLQARVGCGKCGGRGHRGFNLTTKTHIPCRCVMVDMEKLTAAWKEKVKQFETNIPSLTEQPGPPPQGQTIIDQPQPEAILGNP